jgi:hypothetical protein
METVGSLVPSHEGSPLSPSTHGLILMNPPAPCSMAKDVPPSAGLISRKTNTAEVDLSHRVSDGEWIKELI